jgi:hypothetical protein
MQAAAKPVQAQVGRRNITRSIDSDPLILSPVGGSTGYASKQQRGTAVGVHTAHAAVRPKRWPWRWGMIQWSCPSTLRIGGSALTFRFEFSGKGRLGSGRTTIALPAQADTAQEVSIQTSGGGQIRDEAEFLLIGKGFGSAGDAIESGIRWRDYLQKALAYRRVAADFGDREETEDGLANLIERDGDRWADDSFGVQVFECEPWPRFGRVLPGSVFTTPSEEQLLEAIGLAVERDARMSRTERLAFDIYSASFRESAADARLVTLMMAVETLLDRQSRSDAAIGHVDKLIAFTQQSDLPPGEIESLLSGLKDFRKESISSAGRRAAKALGRRYYMRESPAGFFTACYKIRSKLVHGAIPRPSQNEVSARAEALRHFVGDLLTRDMH